MKRIYYIIPLSLLIFFASCDYNNDDTPPVEPFIPGNRVSIADLKAIYDWNNRGPVEITENWCIKGIISAEDKSSNNNLYKEAYIQDETGGLRLLFEATGGLYVNDSAIINLKDLFISDYGKFLQLTSFPYKDGEYYRGYGINKNKHLKRTVVLNQELLPLNITIDQIEEQHLGMLIKLNKVKFLKGGSDTYATPQTDENDAAYGNQILSDANGNEITVRTSGYASFAGDLLPTGEGSIVGIVSKFTNNRDVTTIQLIIRHYDEVQFD